MTRWLAKLISSQEQARLADALHWLYQFVKPHRTAIYGLLLLSLIASGITLLQPWLTKMLIDDGLVAGNFNALLAVALAMVSVGILGTVLSGVSRYLHTRLSGQILFSLRDALYQHLQKLSPSFYSQWRMGDLFTRLDGDVAEIQRFAVDALFSAISNLLGLLGALILLVSLSWKLALLVLVLVPLELLWLRWMRRKVENNSRALREKASDISSFMVETLPAMKFIQAAVQEEREARRLRELSGNYLQQLLRLQLTEFFTQAVPNLLTSITRATAFIIGGYWVIQGTWQLGALIAFSTYLGMVIGPAQSLLGLYVSIQRMSVSLTRVQELQAAPIAVTSEQARPLPIESPGRIELQGVSFTHQGRAEPTLSQVNAQFQAGQKIALVGGSGAGKSTLIDLLQRFYLPQEGVILLDGQDIQQFDLAAFRRKVAVVSQDIVLFRGSLADNLRYVAPAATDAEILAVLQQVQLQGLLDQLPQGIDTPLAERGQQLSGGQKQRIAIARALLQQPILLILDEATSAVDEATEQRIMQEVDRLFARCTRIVISHRSHTWQQADACWLLRDGQLIQKNLARVISHV
ncbi:ABC transporter ATP-binding protein [Thiopseudomonas alkaliphila]|uniref:ABC transporter ATP-binding protein n=1 Tax=Thiopseudomonas alkaliphila TaxID=1697053 RepID=UPI00069F6998|nr:ABC transporter ATP-binding protein [Thiopseudomonas alkaliphila]AKX51669.1 ABC transporter ATP-binding protein [Thiopseudomonas alkaliphila]AKX55918.1 ABC transporter ATP-binding protein [Thiopseudomonas alkaliphila]AKX56938.1 ABC transporter ATP-binding protein [Thiopseudomonas alkaliphila]